MSSKNKKGTDNKINKSKKKKEVEEVEEEEIEEILSDSSEKIIDKKKKSKINNEHKKEEELLEKKELIEDKEILEDEEVVDKKKKEVKKVIDIEIKNEIKNDNNITEQKITLPPKRVFNNFSNTYKKSNIPINPRFKRYDNYQERTFKSISEFNRKEYFNYHRDINTMDYQDILKYLIVKSESDNKHILTRLFIDILKFQNQEIFCPHKI